MKTFLLWKKKQRYARIIRIQAMIRALDGRNETCLKLDLKRMDIEGDS